MVNIQNLESSWYDALGFLALLHAYDPSFINWAAIQKEVRAVEGLGKDDPKRKELVVKHATLAIDTAESRLSIPRILEAEELASGVVDGRIMLLYISEYFHAFGKVKQDDRAGLRVRRIIELSKLLDTTREEYEKEANELKEWLDASKLRYTPEIYTRDSLETCADIEREIDALGQFSIGKTADSIPSHVKNLAKVEALFSQFNVMLRSEGRKPYVPSDARLNAKQLHGQFEKLQLDVHSYRAWLRKELKREFQIESNCVRFDTKSQAVSRWMKETATPALDRPVGDGYDVLVAQQRQHEAFCKELKSTQEKVKVLGNIVNQIRSLKGEFAEKQKTLAEIEKELQELAKKSNTRTKQLDKEVTSVERVETSRRAHAKQLFDSIGILKALEAEASCLVVDPRLRTGSVSDVETCSRELKKKMKDIEKQAKVCVKASRDKAKALSDPANPLTILTIADVEKEHGVLTETIGKAFDEIDALVREVKNRAKLKKDLQEEHKALNEAFEIVRLQEVQADAIKGTLEAREIITQLADVAVPLTLQPRVSRISELVTQIGSHDTEAKDIETAARLQVSSLSKRLAAKRSALDKVAELDEKEAKAAEERKKAKAEANVLLEYAVEVSKVLSTLDEILDYATEPLPKGSINTHAMKREFDTYQNRFADAYDPFCAVLEQSAKFDEDVRAYTPATPAFLSRRWEELDNAMQDKEKRVKEAEEEWEKNEEKKKEIERNLSAVEVKVAEAESLATKARRQTSSDVTHQIESWLAVGKKMANEDSESKSEDYTSVELKDECLVIEDAAQSISDDSLVMRAQSAVQKVTKLEKEWKNATQTLRTKAASESEGEVTADELEEWRSLFNHFDSDETNTLVRHELQALLTSLGEDVSDTEVEELLRKYGSSPITGGMSCTFKQFVNLMTHRSKEHDNYDAVVGAFRVLSGGDEVITMEQLSKAELDHSHVEYVEKAMKEGKNTKGDDGYEFVPFVDHAFGK
eukprot:gnl/Carplike_NY0171/3938_a5319_324.p1 GENE.gnl/Carplike_NY0171/3938_a5319_324~~gnl/Carplike_NY0171/3938_a5319_324.p1  ORF type:complete len:1120 (-),score=473.38 gnl/Carplike_NY0171/3938_a5319_324:280-3231(-)